MAKRMRIGGRSGRGEGPSGSIHASARGGWHWPFAAAALGLLGLLALWSLWPQRPRGVQREPGLSILLITVDTLRADALASYGRPGVATPWSDRAAAQGVRFERAYAHNVVTLPSHANILSGRLPFEHGIRDNSGFRFPGSMPTLATLLRSQGYRTGAFVSAFPLDSRFGLDRGFDVYEDGFVDVDASSALRLQERPAAETVALARRWLEAKAAPSFAWVHLFEPHFPYAPPEPFASRYRADPYHGEVAASDAALGPLLEPLLDAGARGRTLTIITADHGEALGEHGESTHGLFAYEAVLRVPLILHCPRLLRARVVGDTVRHVDLLPTILDALALPVPAGLPGRSLLPLMAGEAASAEPSYFEALSASLTRGWAPLRGVLRDRLKYVELPIQELYDLSRDPSEATNLAATRAQELEGMRKLLRSFLANERGVERRPEEGETAERLAALGYVTSGVAPRRRSYSELDDPKQLVGLDSLLHEVLGLRAAGDLVRAVLVCEELIRRRPDMPTGYVQLAFLRREQGDLVAAVAALKRAQRLSPGDSTTLALLGAYLNESGRADEAAQLLSPHARRDDVDVLVALGVAEAQLGRFAAALATFNRAREVDPSNAMIPVNAGAVYLMKNDVDAARTAFEEALSMKPDLARAHNSLGVIAARQGRHEAAIEHWKRALAVSPEDPDTLFNLGLTLSKAGRHEEARPYLERFLATAPRALYARDLERVRRWLRQSGSDALTTLH